eukprot:scaffold7219_cov129-Isochrysis_galbana.AAC.6
MPSRRRGHGGCFGLCGGVHAKQEAWPLVHVEMQLKLSLFFLVRATKGAVQEGKGVCVSPMTAGPWCSRAVL